MSMTRQQLIQQFQIKTLEEFRQDHTWEQLAMMYDDIIGSQPSRNWNKGDIVCKLYAEVMQSSRTLFQLECHHWTDNQRTMNFTVSGSTARREYAVALHNLLLEAGYTISHAEIPFPDNDSE